jgi:hypothetical protein
VKGNDPKIDEYTETKEHREQRRQRLQHDDGGVVNYTLATPQKMASNNRPLTLPKSHPKSRNNLDPVIVNAVDTCLKSLRKTSRKLPPTISSHASETRILERIVYKNKNQHGRTLFFRNLVEIKRFATRIEEASLSKLIETTRAAFYSHEVADGSAW